MYTAFRTFPEVHRDILAFFETTPAIKTLNDIPEAARTLTLQELLQVGCHVITKKMDQHERFYEVDTPPEVFIEFLSLSKEEQIRYADAPAQVFSFTNKAFFEEQVCMCLERAFLNMAGWAEMINITGVAGLAQMTYAAAYWRRYESETQRLYESAVNVLKKKYSAAI